MVEPDKDNQRWIRIRVFFKSFLKVLLKFLALLTVSIVAVSAGGGLAFYLFFTHGVPTVQELQDYPPKNVIDPFAESDIPKHLADAFVAAENPHFFDDDWPPRLTLKKLVCIIKRDSSCRYVPFDYLSSGVARRLLPRTAGRILTRPIKESILSGRLYDAWSKKKILYVYLNKIYLGGKSYGVKKAAQYYFNKEVQDLSIAEAALLAGVSRAPSHYSPFRNPEKALERRNNVLYTMHSQGFISEEQYRKAVKEELKLRQRITGLW